MVSRVSTWGTYIIKFTLALSYELVKNRLRPTNSVMMLLLSLRIRMIPTLGPLIIALAKLSGS